jgi:hypothetical protein
MTGPEHYREAEQALDRASHEDFGTAAEHYHVARAQAHALLALTAATAIRPSGYNCARPEWTAWAEVASVETARRNGHAHTGRDGGVR